MHKVLQEFLHKFVLVYIADILVYSSMAKHHHYVAVVLKCQREYHRFLKDEKCSFHQSSVQFLGYNISSIVIHMNKGIQELASTHNHQSFLCFSNFYRRFVHNYCSIAYPLISLLKNKPKSLSRSPSAT